MEKNIKNSEETSVEIVNSAEVHRHAQLAVGGNAGHGTVSIELLTGGIVMAHGGELAVFVCIIEYSIFQSGVVLQQRALLKIPGGGGSKGNKLALFQIT